MHISHDSENADEDEKNSGQLSNIMQTVIDEVFDKNKKPINDDDI